MMGTAKHIGRIGALAVALGVGMATVAPVPTASASSAPCTRTDRTCALIMGMSGVPTPDDFCVESVKNQFIAPTHPTQPGQEIGYDAVTTPEELWPFAGVGRLVSLLGIGSPEIFGVGGPTWDVPWWKLPGLFDLTLNQSVLQGVTDLEDAIAERPNDHVVIFGYSQSALIANRVKRKLAAQYPAGTDAPDIDFVLGGDPNLPNGGLMARFPGLYIPILDWSFNGPAPTDTQFDTVEITRQYDFMADFPLYPLNLVADLNAALGFFYVHAYPFDVSLAPDASTSPAFQGTHGDTSYYFFETQDLPLFAPLRMLGVPESLIDVVEPFFREVVELGYDRSIPPWEPTPARLIPKFNPATVAGDFVDAIEEGIDNAGVLVKPPAPLNTRAASTNTDVDEAAQEAELQTNESISAVESVDNARTTMSSPGRTNDSTHFNAGHARQTPLRDAVRHVSSGIKEAVAKVSDSIKKAVTMGKHDDIKGDREDAGRQSPVSTSSG